MQQGRSRRRWRTVAALALVALGPILAVATFSALGEIDRPGAPTSLRFWFLLDLVYVLVVATLVIGTILRTVIARRRRAAGARLHLRLSGLFGAMALIPTVIVAVFATVTLNFGLEGWFSERVSGALAASRAAAEAYQAEETGALRVDAEALARFLDAQRIREPRLAGGRLRDILTAGQTQIQRGLQEAFVINGQAEIVSRGDGSYLFYFEPPSADALARAAAGETVLLEDYGLNEYHALIRLGAFQDRYLWVSRQVDGQLLTLLDDTSATVALYQQIEADRSQLLFQFALIYLGFALIVILAAVWLGLWYAERLARPVGRLAGAAERVGAGDFDTRVIEEAGDDEIATLSRVFNRMTGQVKVQRDALIAAHDETERRRRLFDSVLTGVTAGVIGLDADGKVDLVNTAAVVLLGLGEVEGTGIAEAVPEFAPLFADVQGRAVAVTNGNLEIERGGRSFTLLVRAAGRRGQGSAIEGYAITFDDVTDLVSAQRMAAWGDVARRIAHEIKNPLTPIQLSAERMRRKFGPKLGEDRQALEQYSDVIIRQTGDLRRIVDEFSRFARMPRPEREVQDITLVLRDAVALQSAAHDNVVFSLEGLEQTVEASIDPTMIGQALTNLLKNAIEATEAVEAEGHVPKIVVALSIEGDRAVIEIADNGIGLPPQRHKLFEPYVTHRDGGTGLGLPIVKKIVEEHGGSLELTDAPPFAPDAKPGALARVTLPVAEARPKVA